MHASIHNIEYCFPDKKVTNELLKSSFPDYDFGRFESKVGIKSRYWVSDNETALDLAVSACNKLFEKFDRNSVDFVILCTQSPEYFLPTTACILQDRIGLRKSVGALDFNLGCSGYVYGLSLAKGLVESGQCSNVLLVTAETYSKYIHPQDKSNKAIFGDAASASIISSSNEDGLNSFLFGTDGSGAEKLIIKNGANKNSLESNPNLREYGSGNFYSDNHLYMNGPDIFNFTLEVIPQFVEDVVKKNGSSIDEIDYFIFHQANAFMLDFLRKKINIKKERFYIDLEDGGNTVSNTIPIALKRFSEKVTIIQPLKVLLVGFGVGLSWSGGLITLNRNV